MRAIGIHYSDSHFHYVVLNQSGEIAQRGKVRANRDDLRREFCAIEPTCIAMQWTASTRWAAEMLSGMHHSVLYSVVVRQTSKRDGGAPRAAENAGGLAHELYAPVTDWRQVEQGVPVPAAKCKAELHARRLRRQWAQGVAMMRMHETAIYV